MREWSFSLGRLFGIKIEIHYVLIIWLLVDLVESPNRDHSLLRWGMLIASVFLHEMGHCLAARSVGGHAEKILLWRFGGLAYVQSPHHPRARFKVSAGGPIVNLIILLICIPIVNFQGGQIGTVFFWKLFPNFSYSGYPGLLAGINMDLLLLNLIPAFPLDGSNMLKCILWGRGSEQKAEAVVSIIGIICGSIVFAIGFFLAHMFLLFIGTMCIVYSEAKRREHSPQAAQYGENPEFFWTKWWRLFQEWRQEKKEHQEQLKAEQNARASFDRKRRVDELLQKVSESGLDSLSPKERKDLEEHSKHF